MHAIQYIPPSNFRDFFVIRDTSNVDKGETKGKTREKKKIPNSTLFQKKRYFEQPAP